MTPLRVHGMATEAASGHATPCRKLDGPDGFKADVYMHRECIASKRTAFTPAQTCFCCTSDVGPVLWTSIACKPRLVNSKLTQ